MVKLSDKQKNNIKKFKKLKEVSKDTIINAVKKSFKLNWLWYLSLLITSIILNLNQLNFKSIMKTLVSIIVVIYSGWLIHFISHKINFKSWFNESNNLFKHYSLSNKLVNYTCDLLDFHDVYHHNSNINRQFKYLFYEFINNIFSQGLLILIALYFFNKLIKNFDFSVCFLWGLAYATIHIFNYNIIQSKVHEDHHLDSRTNYGIDIIDIICGTKKNYKDIEEHNHYSINFIILSIIIFLFNNYFKDENWYNKIKLELLN